MDIRDINLGHIRDHIGMCVAGKLFLCRSDFIKVYYTTVSSKFDKIGQERYVLKFKHELKFFDMYLGIVLGAILRRILRRFL